MMLLVALLIILCIAFKIRSPIPIQSGGANIKSGMDHTQSVEKEVGTHIAPQITYTYRYLAKYSSKLIHEYIMELEQIYMGSVTPKLQIPKQKQMKTLSLSNAPEISKVLQYLISRLNASPAVYNIPSNYNYDINTEVAMITLIKTPFYNITRHYNKNLDANITNTVNLLFKLKNKQIISMGVAGLPKRSFYKGTNGVRAPYARAFRDFKFGIPQDQIEPILRSVISDRLDYILSKCFLPAEKLYVKDTENEQSCIINGGKWDKPCYTDVDCPYFQANKNYPNRFGGCNRATGYCELPKGMINATYRTVSKKDEAICYNCANGSIGKCCKHQKSPDYQFKGDLKDRRKYQQILRNKGLNWYQY